MAITRTHFAYRIDLCTDDEKEVVEHLTMMTSRLRWRPTMPPSNVGLTRQPPYARAGM